MDSKLENVEKKESTLIDGVAQLITQTNFRVAITLNVEVSQLYWKIGNYILSEMKYETYTQYGKHILTVLSQTLIEKFGKGYSYSALIRMVKVAQTYSDFKMFATLSQTLNWSHFIELSYIKDETKRTFYQQLCNAEKWSIRLLRKKQDEMLFERTLIASKPEDEIIQTLESVDANNTTADVVFKSSYILDFLGLGSYYSEKELEDAILIQLEKFILELGQGFAFLERQKRMSIDSVDYNLDLLFYHRKLKRLVAIDLKLGKFKPEYKGQMELYLKYLQKYEMQENEETPIGLLLCSEGNTEHIELLLLDDNNIKIAQYLTAFPDKQWFIDKLNKSIAIAQANNTAKSPDTVCTL